ncbi:MAG: serine/threonine-protein kinase [Pseudomonadota bacterium]
MTDPLPAAPHSVAPRARRLSSSDFGQGDVLAEKYRIECVLGEGGMGIVLRATHMDLGCPVAIKVMRPEHAQHEEAVNRLLVEARAAASIRSEHVARVLDVGRLDSGAPFLVLEYLEGRDLAQILSKVGRLASHVAVDFVLQACQALCEAHGAGVIHRDLKPENLFLTHRADGTPVIKVLDFGISKRLTREGREGARTNPSELLGSPLYMAPEQMRGSADIDERADIWSLGVVLYELCTGQSPFFGESIPAICARVIGMEPTPPRSLQPSLPSGLEGIILRCLRKERDARPANIAELATALAAYGSTNAASYASSALRVMANSRTDPALEVPIGERMTAPSPTLAVLGHGLYARRARRFRPRVQLVGAALAATTLLGGVLTLRAGEAREASVQSMPLRNVAPRLPEPVSCAIPSASSQPAPPALSASTAPVSAKLPTTAKRTQKSGSRNPWDPKSFGGRL